MGCGGGSPKGLREQGLAQPDDPGVCAVPAFIPGPFLDPEGGRLCPGSRCVRTPAVIEKA